IYYELGDYDKDIEYLNKTLEIELNTVATNHPDLDRTYHNLSTAFHEQNKLNEALKYMQMEKMFTTQSSTFY
ncbi:unnamed protein product, partial [Didymodactylos carnosus]